MLKEIKTLNPGAKQNKSSEDLRARPSPAKLPTYVKGLKESLSREGIRLQLKAGAHLTERGPSTNPSKQQNMAASALSWLHRSGFRDKDTRKGL